MGFPFLFAGTAGWIPLCIRKVMSGFLVCVSLQATFVLFCNVWLGVRGGGGVLTIVRAFLVIRVLVFTVFCIVCTVFLCCFVYVYLFLLFCVCTSVWTTATE